MKQTIAKRIEITSEELITALGIKDVDKLVSINFCYNANGSLNTDKVILSIDVKA